MIADIQIAELLACPFCGSAVTAHAHADTEGTGVALVRHPWSSKCPVKMEVSWNAWTETKADGIERLRGVWNRRGGQ